ncbi:hypothetical protein [Paucibacter sp. M5-1]|uniref:hypothetical protein n=1 Tax=Paucibacter sp. M5-1 TaxID=3015998 RepID=UPI0022B91E43|nr:hypothetical protein [Paucibacter sp. M5-1]MCZ7883615.1 hypothetical protein [Paucibacter sp. M5-1]
MISKRIGIVSALLAGIALWRRQARRQQQHAAVAGSPVKPQEVNTWEGEGGALRGSGSQLGPAPSQ